MDRDYLIWLTGIWYRSSSPVIDPSLRFRLILTGTGISSFVNQIVMSSSLRKNFPTTVLEINRWQGSGPYMVFMVSSPVYLILRSQSLFDIKICITTGNPWCILSSMKLLRKWWKPVFWAMDSPLYSGTGAGWDGGVPLKTDAIRIVNISWRPNAIFLSLVVMGLIHLKNCYVS